VLVPVRVLELVLHVKERDAGRRGDEDRREVDRNERTKPIHSEKPAMSAMIARFVDMTLNR